MRARMRKGEGDVYMSSESCVLVSNFLAPIMIVLPTSRVPSTFSLS